MIKRLPIFSKYLKLASRLHHVPINLVLIVDVGVGEVGRVCPIYIFFLSSCAFFTTAN